MTAQISETTLLVIALAPLVGSLVAGMAGRRIGRANSHRVTILGVAISFVLYRISGEATRLPLEMTTETALFVFGLTVVMCTLSALMALRKVRSADPAEIF